ncbi:MAG TPA: endonuclease VII domain-containing protein [Acidimicrobiales bacterium]|nr:endonuclease VII domain-containing protein [Acidimicrobiales bacterium]
MKAKDRAGHLRRKFGITLETYDEMLAAQEGVCGICERPPRDDISLHVDHEHGTGRVRGLLCFRCNNALGDFEDDAVLLLRAADYVVFDPEARQRATQRVAALVAEHSR